MVMRTGASLDGGPLSSSKAVLTRVRYFAAAEMWGQSNKSNIRACIDSITEVRDCVSTAQILHRVAELDSIGCMALSVADHAGRLLFGMLPLSHTHMLQSAPEGCSRRGTVVNLSVVGKISALHAAVVTFSCDCSMTRTKSTRAHQRRSAFCSISCGFVNVATHVHRPARL